MRCYLRFGGLYRLTNGRVNISPVGFWMLAGNNRGLLFLDKA
ncbi:hypothetical protein FHS20_001597 [Phyllobacterium endophyticum]|nr:hypothetical protein [Phyllobacterium endophyticum]